MKNFVQAGETVTVTAPYAVTSGGGVLVGQIFGVAAYTALISTAVEIMREGVFDIAKDANAAAAGQSAYWDDTNKVVTAVPSGGKPVGTFTVAALSGDATGRVLLDGNRGAQMFVSAERTATGSAENVAHGMGVVPSAVLVIPTDTAPATAGVFTVTEGTHTTVNAIVTVTANKKYKVMAFA